MAIDMRRVVLAAVQAALEEPDPGPSRTKRKKRLSGGRAVLIGAGLMTAGRLAAAGRGRGMLESLQERLGDHDAANGDYFVADADDEVDDDEFADEEFDDELEAEAEGLEDDDHLDEEDGDFEEQEGEDVSDEEGEEEEEADDGEPEAEQGDEPLSGASSGRSGRRGGRTRR